MTKNINEIALEAHSEAKKTCIVQKKIGMTNRHGQRERNKIFEKIYRRVRKLQKQLNKKEEAERKMNYQRNS